jgi:hypothetical protein
MAAVALSHAQALRVIGQKLVPLGVNCFKLAKRGNDYIVWINRDESGRHTPAKKTVFSKIIQGILGHVDADKETLNRLYFSDWDLLVADIEQQSKRKLDSPKDIRDIAFVLRVMGDYMDRKAAREFTVSWSTDSIKVEYDRKTESFTLQNLYDFGINMYLKRSNRHRTH